MHMAYGALSVGAAHALYGTTEHCPVNASPCATVGPVRIDQFRQGPSAADLLNLLHCFALWCKSPATDQALGFGHGMEESAGANQSMHLRVFRAHVGKKA